MTDEREHRSPLAAVLMWFLVGAIGMGLGFAAMIAALQLDYELHAKGLFAHVAPLAVFGGTLYALMIHFGRAFPALSNLVPAAHGILLAPYVLAGCEILLLLDPPHRIGFSSLLLALGVIAYCRWKELRAPSAAEWISCLLLAAVIHPLSQIKENPYYLIPAFVSAAALFIDIGLPRRIFRFIDSLRPLSKALIGTYCTLWIVTIVWGIPDVQAAAKIRSKSLNLSSPIPLFVVARNRPDCWWEKERITGGYFWFFGYRYGGLRIVFECSIM